MMAKTDVEIKIGADTKAAKKSVKKFAVSATAALKGVGSSFNLLNTAAAGLATFFAGRALLNGIQSVTDAAIIQENAIKRLNTSLKLAGDFSTETSNDMQKFASDLQSVTTTGDEATLEMLALAKSFDITNEGAKELVTAAVDLSAATGISLDSAVKNLGKTMGGLTGELGEVVPALRNLTAEELKAGEGIKLVGERFATAAQKMTNTFGGSSEQLTNIVGDLREELGFLITKNPVFVGAIKAASKGFTKLIEIVNDNRKAVISVVNKGFLFLVKQIPKIIRAFSFIAKGVQGIALAFQVVKQALSEFVLALLEIEFINDVFEGIVDGIRLIEIGFLEAGRGIINFVSKIPGIGSAFESVVGDVDELNESLEQTQVDLAGVIDESTTDSIKDNMIAIREEALDAGFEIDNFFNKITGGIDKVADIAESGVGEVEKVVKKFEKDGGLSDIAVGVEVDEVIDTGFLEKTKEAFNKIYEKAATNAIKIATSVVAAMGKGAEGARSLLVSGAGAIGNILLPGFGGFIGEFATLLTQEPEALKKSLQGFIDAFPQLFIAIGENIDVIIEAVIDSLLINGGLERIIVAILKGTLKAAEALTVGLLASVRDAIIAMFKNLGKVFRIDTPDWVQSLIDALNFGPDDKDKGKGVLRETLGIGFSKGGMVPKLATGGSVSSVGGVGSSDTIPALLTPGEIVVDRTTTGQLQDFLNGNGDQNVQIMSLLTNIISLLGKPMSVSTTAEVDGNAFADIILELNRTNARLA